MNIAMAFVIFSFTCCSSSNKENISSEKIEELYTESNRIENVNNLINELNFSPSGNRNDSFIELRDNLLRKRDISYLNERINRTDNQDVVDILNDLIAYIDREHWRLPDKGWTDDIYECIRKYEKIFDELGCLGFVRMVDTLRGDQIIELEILRLPELDDKIDDLVRLIHTLEPQSLRIWGEQWSDITFMSLNKNLEELHLKRTSITDFSSLNLLPNVKKIHISQDESFDMSFLESEFSLEVLVLHGTFTIDLNLLQRHKNIRTLDLRYVFINNSIEIAGLSDLEILILNDTNISDLTAISNLNNLWYLSLENTLISDLRPLEGLFMLRELNIKNTKVDDLSSLSKLDQLRWINIENINVADLSPLKNLPRLRHIKQ